MSIELIVILVFVAVIVVFSIATRKSTLDKLEKLPGEETLFEEEGIRVEQAGAPRTAVFINCIVRVTSRRIIIAQKMLFGKTYALRHVITYDVYSDETDLAQSLRKGYLNFEVTRSKVKLERDSERCLITIPIPASALTGNQYVQYETGKGDDYSRTFG
jgi:hypothetical protein